MLNFLKFEAGDRARYYQEYGARGQQHLSSLPKSGGSTMKS